MKRFLVLFLKLLLGAGLLYFLWTRGKLNPTTIATVLTKPLWILSLALMTICTFIGALRWQLLLKGVGLSIRFMRVLRFLFMGALAQLVTPGVLGADLLRGALMVKSTKESRYEAGLSVAIDRYLGTTALFTWAAIAFLFRPLSIQNDPMLLTLGIIVLSSAIGLPILLIIGSSKSIALLLQRFIPWIFNRGFGSSLLTALHRYSAKPKTLIIGFLLSLILQGLNIIMVLPLIAAMGIHLPLSFVGFIIPIGLLVLAVPLMPMGLGIGQVAFVTMFQRAGLQGSIGVELVTLIQVTSLVCFLVGGLISLWWPSTSKLQIATPIAEST